MLKMIVALGLSAITAIPQVSLADSERRIAFISDRDKRKEIYQMDDAGAVQTRLIGDMVIGSTFSWSPDGSHIAFALDPADPEGTGPMGLGGTEIFVMSADGADQTMLTNAPGRDQNPSWSPDGRKIAFDSGREGNGEIFVMNADGSGQINLTMDPAGDSSPSWSPDGTKIVYTSFRDGGVSVMVMDVDGGNQINLTNRPSGFELEPCWSPDGTKIAFSSDREGDIEIYVMDADGRNPVNLTKSPGLDLSPSWSPDGKQTIEIRMLRSI